MGLFTKGGNGKRIFYKTNAEVELIRKSCHLVCKTLAHVGSMLRPGITGDELDQAAEEFIRDHGAKPAFKGYNDFPSTLCISKNDVVVHGIPNKKEFQDTDIVSIDCGVEMDGFFGDAAYTFAFPNIPAETLELLTVTYKSLYVGIENAVHGKRVGDISWAVQDYVEKKQPHRYGVVRQLVGHGLGRELHEDPEVPNYGQRGKGNLMLDGLVLAIEPMITLGDYDVYQGEDHWAIHTRDRKAAAHYEHTVVVRKQKADILSDHSYILDEVKKNAALQLVLPKI